MHRSKRICAGCRNCASQAEKACLGAIRQCGSRGNMQIETICADGGKNLPGAMVPHQYIHANFSCQQLWRAVRAGVFRKILRIVRLIFGGFCNPPAHGGRPTGGCRAHRCRRWKETVSTFDTDRPSTPLKDIRATQMDCRTYRSPAPGGL